MSNDYTATGKHLSPASFWVPQCLEASAWADHAPFAFWLMERHQPRTLVELGTHGGYSYFAFCQAVKAGNLSTQCYAVDTWRGDEHTGFYDEAFFQRVSDYNEANYAAFSRLVRSTFDEAVKHFSDGSIDLLHIDGLHFYEDVKHDFETWRPKLSDRAIVLFHDTNVRERNFGVFQLWEELRSDFPSFEFLHGHGLGVLGFGPNLPADTLEFFTAAKKPGCATEIRQAYDRLGGAFKTEVIIKERLEDEKGKFTALEATLETSENASRGLEDDVRRLENEIHDFAAREVEMKAGMSAVENTLKQAAARLELQWTHIEELTLRLGAKERELDVQEQKLDAKEEVLRSIKRSTSWRLTAPLRVVRRLPKQILLSIHHVMKASLRIAFYHTPLPQSVKMKLVDASFRIAPVLFENTSVFRRWETRHRREQAEFLVSKRLRPPNEVARPFEIDFSAAVPFQHCPTVTAAPKLAVICHLFYESMTPEFQRYFSNIPFPFDLFISTDTPAKKAIIEKFFEAWDLGKFEVRIAENRGRDIAPKLILFREVYDAYEYVLHVHSKASDHASELGAWRSFLLENLLGTPDIVSSVFAAFAQRSDLGIVASQHFEPMRQWVNWGGNFDVANDVASRMGMVLLPDNALDFPSGSMFWARSSALRPLLDLNLTIEDFDAEGNQIDGTLAHSIERLYYYVCERAQYKWIKISHPPLFEHTPSIIPIESPDSLDQFISEHTLTLTGPDTPKPRAVHPEPVKPAAQLVSRLQEKALGEDQEIDPKTNVAVGIVTFNNSVRQIRTIIKSAQAALTKAGLTSGKRVFVADNSDSSQSLINADDSVNCLPAIGNVGFGKAHNRLMLEAFTNGADIYVAANPDGAFHPNAIRALVKMMRAHRGRALIEAIQFPDEHPKVYDPYTFETYWASGACVAIPRLLFETIGGFDDTFFMFCEDVDLSWRARANGFAVRICPRALFLHKVTNRDTDPARLKMIFNSGIVLARKWGAPKFEDWLTTELKAIGFEPSDVQPVSVPEEWRCVADFEHQLSFSQTRW